MKAIIFTMATLLSIAANAEAQEDVITTTISATVAKSCPVHLKDQKTLICGRFAFVSADLQYTVAKALSKRGLLNLGGTIEEANGVETFVITSVSKKLE